MTKTEQNLLLGFMGDTYVVTQYQHLVVDLLGDHHTSIHFMSKKPCKLTIGSLATLSIEGKKFIDGIIMGYQQLGLQFNHYHYTVELRSPLAKLDHIRKSRQFVKIKLQTLLNILLTDCNPLVVKHLHDLSNRFIAYHCQHNETDFQFLQKSLKQYGLSAVFDYRNEATILYITDNLQKLDAIFAKHTLPYKPFNTGTASSQVIYDHCVSYHLYTDHYRLVDYNPQAEQANIHCSSHSNTKINTIGQKTLAFKNCKTKDEANQTIQLAQTALDASRQHILLNTNEAHLQIGQAISMITNDNTQHFRIIAIKQQGRQNLTGNDNNTHLLNSNCVTCIPINQPVAQYNLQQQATLASKQAQTATNTQMDQYGRYALQFDGDHSTITPAFRRLQCSNGPSHKAAYGTHLPLKAKQAVLVGFLNEDPDQAIILGVIPNPQHPSPVTHHNPGQFVIRTDTGNTVCFDQSNAGIYLKTQTKNQLQLTQQLAELSSMGTLTLSSKQALNINAGQQISLQVFAHYKQTTILNHTVVANSILLNAANSFQCYAKQAIKFEANALQISAKRVDLTAKHIAVHLRKQSVDLHSRAIKLTSKQALSVNAQKSLAFSSLSMKLSGIQINPKTLSISANNIQIYQNSAIND